MVVAASGVFTTRVLHTAYGWRQATAGTFTVLLLRLPLMVSTWPRGLRHISRPSSWQRVKSRGIPATTQDVASLDVQGYPVLGP